MKGPYSQPGKNVLNIKFCQKLCNAVCSVQAATDSVNKSTKTKGFTFRKKALKLG
jgi:hypothetical protein